MANGAPCALPDGHKDHCHSETGAKRQARYKSTAKGILADLRYKATQRGNR